MKILLTLLAITLSFTSALKAADPTKPYSLTTCIVSGDTLDSMGKPVVVVYEGQEIKFCCKRCIKKFNANPAKYMKDIEIAKSKKSS